MKKALLLLLMLTVWPCQACEILVRLAPGSTNVMAYQRGMPVLVMPDGHQWGREERPPLFTVLKLPGVTPNQVAKYVQPWQEGESMVRRRLWQVRVEDIPAGARAKILAGSITIGPGGDYTWVQFRTFLRNLQTGLDETNNL